MFTNHMKMLKLLLVSLMLSAFARASDVEKSSLVVLGIGLEYSSQTTAQEFHSGKQLQVWFNWLELETGDLKLKLPSKLFNDMKPGKWIEQDPVVEFDARSLLIEIGGETWSVGPSEIREGKIMFRQIRRLGGLTYTWADKAGSFLQPELYKILKNTLSKHSPEQGSIEKAGPGQPATRSQSKSETNDKPQPESEVRPR
jgi:hypothetical protein